MFGQELNAESYAICKADMLIKGQDVANIVCGNTLSDDGHAGTASSTTCSPIRRSAWSGRRSRRRSARSTSSKGFNGRFGPGLPRVSATARCCSCCTCSRRCGPPQDGGSRFGIVLNGSPLFTGGAGSGESEIRRYVLENDLVEAIIGLPTDMFYNTGISHLRLDRLATASPPQRKGKVQLIDATQLLAEDAQEPRLQAQGAERGAHRDITRLFGGFVEAQLATCSTPRARRSAAGCAKAKPPTRPKAAR